MGKGETTPATLKLLNPMVTKICVGDYIGDTFRRAKFYPNQLRDFVSAHAVISRPLATKWLSYFFWWGVLEKGYRRDAHRFWRKIRQTTRFRTSAQWSVFWGSTFWGPCMYDNCDNCARSTGQRSRSQGHVTYQQQERYNSVVDSHTNFKLGGNYRRAGRRVWYTFQASRSNKPGLANFQHIKCKKINGKRRQIAEISHSIRKSGSGNRTVMSKFTLEVHK